MSPVEGAYGYRLVAAGLPLERWSEELVRDVAQVAGDGDEE